MSLFIVFFTFLIASTIGPASTPKKLEKVSLQLHWKYQFEFAGFITAKEKGFYKDEGLDVELKEYNFGIDIEKDIISAESNYGIYNSLSLLEYLRGKPLVLVSSYFKRAALVLATAPEIKTPKDLVPHSYSIDTFINSIGSIDENFLRKQITLFKSEYNVGKNKNIKSFIFDYIDEKEKLFTKAEKVYIRNSKKISLCLLYVQFPIDGFAEHKMTGIMSDVYAKISQTTGLSFMPIVSSSDDELRAKMQKKMMQMLLNKKLML